MEVGGAQSLRRVTARRVLLGNGVSIDDAQVVMREGRIEAVGSRRDPFDGETVGVFDDGVVVPGLIDAHVHLCFSYQEGFRRDGRSLETSIMTNEVRSRCRRLVGAGVTSVRDLGSVGDVMQLTRDAIQRGEVLGPRIVCSGPPLTTPTGHLRAIGLLASGEADCVEAVKALVSSGVDVVKVVATGGASTPGTLMGRAQFSLRELVAIVATADRAGLPVAAHAHGTEGIALVVAAGVRTVEHCSWIEPGGGVGPVDVEVVGEMRRRHQVAVMAGPLPHELVTGLDRNVGGDVEDGSASERLLAMWTNARRARDLGVDHALGTDALFGQFEDFRDLAWRAQALVDVAGWPPRLVLEALWQGGASALGMSGKIGVVAPGAYADLAILGGDPRIDIAALRDVRAVVRGGLRVF